jgi:hypothetical protein
VAITVFRRASGGRNLAYYPHLAVGHHAVGPHAVYFYPASPPAADGTRAPGAPKEDLESTEIKPPPEGASVAEAQPIGIAIAGPGGVAAAQPIGTAVVGPNGLAIARPIGTAIAGVQGISGPMLAGGQLPIAPAANHPPVTVYLTGPVVPHHAVHYYL